MEPVTIETARIIAQAMRAERFERKGYDAKAMAQENLSGKTYYATDDTLRFFYARILRCRAESEGLLLAIVESKAVDYRNTSRGFAFTVFDLFGDVLNDRETPLFKTRDKAEQALSDYLAGFDVLAHYRAALAERAESLTRDAARLAECAAAI